MNYYNEFDPYAAQWLRNLISAGHIPAGDVDDRSITDVCASDLKGYTQCHFFAGIGGWSRALQIAGWPEDKKVWTGSCPCQPFSVAGKGKGTEDERHLWPVWFNLIKECRPPVIFGEQVSAAIRHGWIDGVFADLENEDYACAAAIIPACSVGAPHRRERLWFVADAERATTAGRLQCETCGSSSNDTGREIPAIRGITTNITGNGSDSNSALGDAKHDGFSTAPESGITGEAIHNNAQRADSASEFEGASASRVLSEIDLANAECLRQSGQGQMGESINTAPRGVGEASQPINDSTGFWSDAEWLQCADGKARPVEPSICLLAHGVSRILDGLCAIETRAKERINNYGKSSKRNTSEVLRILQKAIREEACWQEPSIRMRLQLPTPEVLLSFLLCIDATCEAKVGCGIQKTIDEEKLRIMRGLRLRKRNSSSSCEREPSEQYVREFADALLSLSFVLARDAETYWENTREAHAASNRNGALKAYGNAIVPAVAAEFVKAYLES